MISTSQVHKGGLPTETPTFDVITQKHCDRLHYLEHSRDGLLQDVGLFADDFIRNLVRKKQNALQPIENARHHLVVFVLFLQKLHGQASILPPIRQ